MEEISEQKSGTEETEREKNSDKPSYFPYLEVAFGGVLQINLSHLPFPICTTGSIPEILIEATNNGC